MFKTTLPHASAIKYVFNFFKGVNRVVNINFENSNQQQKIDFDNPSRLLLIDDFMNIFVFKILKETHKLWKHQNQNKLQICTYPILGHFF